VKGFNQQAYQRPDECYRPDTTCASCQPVLQRGPDAKLGRWMCTRIPAEGGACAQGPGPHGTCPCVRAHPPIDGLRRQRGRWIGLTFVLPLVVLLATWFSTARETLISPGPLLGAHQAVTANDCAACHQAGKQDPLAWVGSPENDSSLCLACHAMEIPFRAHNVSTNQLADWTANKGGLAHDAPTSCGDCHREHQGETLTTITDRQCASCHSAAFDDFNQGHRAFSASFPAQRRTRIQFDHQAHFDEHFKQDFGTSVPSLCSDCHRPDDSGTTMITQPFAISCASCHQHTRQIEGTVDTQALTVFQLPGIDLDSARKAGSRLEFWPADRRRGGEHLPPIMQLLIRGAAVYPSADYPGALGVFEQDLTRVEQLPKGFRDLRTATPEEIMAIERIAWAVRDLFRELAGAESLDAFRQRLERSAGRPFGHEEFADVSAQLPPALIQQAYQDWFGVE
jgi:hypothetical protein